MHLIKDDAFWHYKVSVSNNSAIVFLQNQIDMYGSATQ